MQMQSEVGSGVPVDGPCDATILYVLGTTPLLSLSPESPWHLVTLKFPGMSLDTGVPWGWVAADGLRHPSQPLEQGAPDPLGLLGDEMPGCIQR